MNKHKWIYAALQDLLVVGIIATAIGCCILTYYLAFGPKAW